jgi:(1->4)-alpha-D-glucan 1-alpha-D-glucosylmutase
LQLRAADEQLFANGAYQPLQVEGTRKDHVLAFARTCESRSCTVIVPRWTAKLMEGATSFPVGEQVWGDTRVILGPVAGDIFHDVLDTRASRIESEGEDRSLRVAQVLAKFPVAVLRSGAPDRRA